MEISSSPVSNPGRLEFQFSIGRLLVATTLVAVAVATQPRFFAEPGGWYVAFILVMIALFYDWSALHLRTAEAAMKWGKYESAIAAYTKAIQGRPNDADRYFRRGVAFYYLKDYKSAVQDFNATVRYNSRHAPGWVWLGSMRQHLNEFQPSIDATTIALCIDPANIDALVLRGAGYYYLGADEKARADFSEAIHLSPRDPRAPVYRGIIEFQRHNCGDAVNDFRRALEIIPDSIEVWIWLAKAYSLKGDCQKSAEAATQALRIASGNVDALLTRGSAHSLNAKYTDALADLNEAIRLAPDNMWGRELRGFCYLWSGMLENALVDFEHALSMPGIGRSQVGRAFTWFKLGNYSQAFQDLEAYVTDKPNDEIGLRVLAWCLATCPVDEFRNGNRALQLGLRAHEIDPKCCWTSAGCVAAAHAELGNFGQAILMGELAVERAAPARRSDYEHALQVYRTAKPYRDMPTATLQE